jgi:hypothetical protein
MRPRSSSHTLANHVKREAMKISVRWESEAKKARIPTINRLNGEPTAAEREFFAAAIRGLNRDEDDERYTKAVQALEEERRRAAGEGGKSEEKPVNPSSGNKAT